MPASQQDRSQFVWTERFDFGRVEWLDKEYFADPPEGSRRILDLVAKLQTQRAVRTQPPEVAAPRLALVHIEIESQDHVASLRPRMYDSYVQLRRRYPLPVLPIGLYLRVGLKGVGIDEYQESFEELNTVRFRYLYVGLPALDAVKYVQGENWLGVALAALMMIRPEQAAWLGAEALRPFPPKRGFRWAIACRPIYGWTRHSNRSSSG